MTPGRDCQDFRVWAGGFGKLGFGGCTVMVFTADLASGYAEMRVSCQ